MAKYQKEDLKIYLKRKDGEHRTKFKEALSHFKNCLRNDNFSKEDIKDLLATKYNDKCVASVGQGCLTEQQAYQNWESIYKTIQEFDFKKDTTEILSNKYDKLLDTVSNGCKTKKPIITNRLLATFFYEYVTATCNKDAFKTIANFMHDNFENYPKPHKRDCWLLNNLDFVKYCRESLEEDYDPLLISYSWDLYLDIKDGKINKLLEDKTMTDKNTNASVLAKNLAELLTKTKNIILHGAPGTGKTYLAREIAKAMGCIDNEIGFVQFHPSYDYTDFVEGIRPTKSEDDTVNGFELRDGVFKKFCENALKNSIGNQKSSNFDDVWNSFLDEIVEKDNFDDFQTVAQGKKFDVTINSKRNLYVTARTETATKMTITKETIRNYLENNQPPKYWKNYVAAIADHIKSQYEIKFSKSADKNAKFVFIIDEINRGELSKIFGELFFAIDPGL